jgi:hypothetical protein
MPKRILIAGALLALALAACNSGNTTPSTTATPSPTPTPVFSANPGITTTLVTAFFQGNYKPGVTVFETTSNNGTIGTPITSQVTNVTGQTKFTGLVPGYSYCWYFNPTPALRTAICTNQWQSGITLGT